MCNRLGTIPACDRRTDILPRHSPRYAYASRGKNWWIARLVYRTRSWTKRNNDQKEIKQTDERTKFEMQSRVRQGSPGNYRYQQSMVSSTCKKVGFEREVKKSCGR